MSDTKQIFAALVKAQTQFGPALKDRVNPAFKSKYADLGACIEAVIDALHANGIALIQRQHPNDGGVAIETVFIHESGESYSAGIFTAPASKQDPQGYGSAMTYARRYSLMAACGIAPEDDDGNAAAVAKKAEDDRRADRRKEFLAACKANIMAAENAGQLKRTLYSAIEAVRRENDEAAVSQLNEWATEKASQAKPKAEE